MKEKRLEMQREKKSNYGVWSIDVMCNWELENAKTPYNVQINEKELNIIRI